MLALRRPVASAVSGLSAATTARSAPKNTFQRGFQSPGASLATTFMIPPRNATIASTVLLQHRQLARQSYPMVNWTTISTWKGNTVSSGSQRTKSTISSSSISSGSSGVSTTTTASGSPASTTTSTSAASATTQSATTASSPTTTPCQVEEIAKSVGVRLTPNELSLLRQKLGGASTEEKTAREAQKAIEKVGQQALQQKTTREICLSVVCSNENPLDKWGVRVINFFDYAGTALFALVGTTAAGDCGMNIVGCCLVGCVAALGGGSLNAMLYGGASPLLGLQPGVRWVAHPSYMLVALAASVLTFFGWPYYCQTQAQNYIQDVMGDNQKLQEENGIRVTLSAFLETWETNPSFRKTIRGALPHLAEKTTRNDQHDYDRINDGTKYFEYIDADGSGDIDMEELKRLVQHRFYNGWETYALDTLGLSSLSIAAVSMSIKLGLHPLVAATSGVTVCFGGLLRDLLCGRNLAIGSQSYAFATGVSSATYICLRELAIRRILVLPLVVRTFLSFGSCILLRGWEYMRSKPLLWPMHEPYM